ncbi:MAG TPA: hypothetical protein VGL91_23170 [Acidobacteriota bacterium]
MDEYRIELGTFGWLAFHSRDTAQWSRNQKRTATLVEPRTGVVE